jgi:hypothetical protein
MYLVLKMERRDYWQNIIIISKDNNHDIFFVQLF